MLQLEALRVSMACNPSVPDAIITAMQGELNKLISTGEQASIIAKYTSVADKTTAPTDRSIVAK